MNLEELRAEVEIKVDDPSYTPDQYNKYINDCIAYAAGLVSIPSLKRMGTVVTLQDQAWVNIASVSSAMDSNRAFNGILRRVKRSDGSFPAVYPDLERLMDDYDLDEEGDIDSVTLEGNNLWYHKIPESPETLTFLAYVNPSLLVRNEDIPTDFPEFLHWKLFVHGTAWKIFDEIEDRSELEGNKPRTTEHYWHSFDDKNRDSGINQLRGWLGRVKSHHISSMWDM